MKVFETILLRDDLTDQKSIMDIKRQIDYYATHGMSTEGISLLPIWDLLATTFEYNEEVLRNKGYILTLADFKKTCQHALEKFDTDSILYNSLLKRLHYAYTVFVKHYVGGRLANEAVVNEMKHYFSRAVQASYLNRAPHFKIMPKQLTIQIGQILESEIEKTVKDWMDKNLQSEVSQEIALELTKQLLNDWQEDKLELEIKKQLEDEKAKNHTTDSLLSCFHDKKLPVKIHNEIQEAVIEEIGKDIQALKIKVTNPLGAAINYIKQNNLIEGNFNLITMLIKNWQSNQLAHEAASQLEDYILQIIKNKNLVNEILLGQQFSKLAVEIFVEKLHQENAYSQIISKTMFSYTVRLLKDLILQVQNGQSSMLHTRDEVYNNAMMQLHDLWISRKLCGNSNVYLEDIVLSELNDLHDKIFQLVHQNSGMKNQIEEMKKQIEGLASELKEYRKIIHKHSDSVGHSLSLPVIEGNMIEGQEQNKSTSKGYNFFAKP